MKENGLYFFKTEYKNKYYIGQCELPGMCDSLIEKSALNCDTQTKLGTEAPSPELKTTNDNV